MEPRKSVMAQHKAVMALVLGIMMFVPTSLYADDLDKDTWLNRGISYGELGRYNDAIEAYRQALRIDPENAGAWDNLGLTYINLERHDKAIEAYREGLLIDPENASAWLALGISYGKLGRYE